MKILYDILFSDKLCNELWKMGTKTILRFFHGNNIKKNRCPDRGNGDITFNYLTDQPTKQTGKGVHREVALLVIKGVCSVCNVMITPPSRFETQKYPANTSIIEVKVFDFGQQNDFNIGRPPEVDI